MLTLDQRWIGSGEPITTLTLPFELRQRSRLRTYLDDGREAALRLSRGGILRHGDRLRTPDGMVVEVRAAPERVSTIRSNNFRLLTRAAYYLGNRHVPLEVGRGYLRYAYDHVLDNLVTSLGLTVSVEIAPFEPEDGAYHEGGGPYHEFHTDELLTYHHPTDEWDD
jgi:urease accessory protein